MRSRCRFWVASSPAAIQQITFSAFTLALTVPAYIPPSGPAKPQHTTTAIMVKRKTTDAGLAETMTMEQKKTKTVGGAKKGERSLLTFCHSHTARDSCLKRALA